MRKTTTTLLAFLALAVAANAQELSQVPLVLKARKVCLAVSFEWSRNIEGFSQKTESAAIFAGAYRAGLLRRYKQTADAADADLIFKVDDDATPSNRVTLEVLNPEDNSSVYFESRDRVALDNDVERLLKHFFEAVDTARDTAREAQAQEKTDEYLRTLASELPSEWETTCSHDTKNCEPHPMKITVLDDKLNEYYQHKSAQGTVSTACVVEYSGSGKEWDGSCEYDIDWSGGQTCSVTISEWVTEVSLTRIAGLSQAIDTTPLRATPPQCPVAGKTYESFAYAPLSDTPEPSPGQSPDVSSSSEDGPNDSAFGKTANPAASPGQGSDVSSRSEDGPNAADPSATELVWIGRFEGQERAQDAVQTIRNLGLPARSVARHVSEKTFWVVWAGPFTPKRAPDVVNWLKSQGFKGAHEFTAPSDNNAPHTTTTEKAHAQ